MGLVLAPADARLAAAHAIFDTFIDSSSPCAVSMPGTITARIATALVRANSMLGFMWAGGGGGGEEAFGFGGGGGSAADAKFGTAAAALPPPPPTTGGGGTTVNALLPASMPRVTPSVPACRWVPLPATRRQQRRGSGGTGGGTSRAAVPIGLPSPAARVGRRRVADRSPSRLLAAMPPWRVPRLLPLTANGRRLEASVASTAADILLFALSPWADAADAKPRCQRTVATVTVRQCRLRLDCVAAGRPGRCRPSGPNLEISNGS